LRRAIGQRRRGDRWRRCEFASQRAGVRESSKGLAEARHEIATLDMLFRWRADRSDACRRIERSHRAGFDCGASCGWCVTANAATARERAAFVADSLAGAMRGQSATDIGSTQVGAQA